MIFIILFLIFMGALEAYVYYKHRYAEDIFLSVLAFGFSMFLSALWVNGGIAW